MFHYCKSESQRRYMMCSSRIRKTEKIKKVFSLSTSSSLPPCVFVGIVRSTCRIGSSEVQQTKENTQPLRVFWTRVCFSLNAVRLALLGKKVFSDGRAQVWAELKHNKQKSSLDVISLFHSYTYSAHELCKLYTQIMYVHSTYCYAISYDHCEHGLHFSVWHNTQNAGILPMALPNIRCLLTIALICIFLYYSVIQTNSCFSMKCAFFLSFISTLKSSLLGDSLCLLCAMFTLENETRET